MALIKSGNNVIVSGYVPRDGELRSYKGDMPMYKFSVKAEEVVGVGGEREAVWVECVVWDKVLAERLTVQKGDRVLVAGEMRCREYTDRNGEVKKVTSISCDFVVKSSFSAPFGGFIPVSENDLPF